jgi:diaminopimelate epimerase
MAAPLVADNQTSLSYSGRRFWKLSGSGNDFIFFDLADGDAAELTDASVIRRLCARGTGIGADGVVFLRAENGGATIRYFNSDGSLGELCGNATLCTVRLLERTQRIPAGKLTINTDAGRIPGRLIDGKPEIDLEPVTEVMPDFESIPKQPGESRLGFARAGVPHVAIVMDSIDDAPIVERGSAVRRHASLRDGANVNFLAPSGGQWNVRTYERGVEGETLACGTGAVACGILLVAWGLAQSPVTLRTRSGRELVVTTREISGQWLPSLRGEADLVFTGSLA